MARRREGIARAGKAAGVIKRRLTDAGFEVQTTRLALAPACCWIAELDLAKSIEAAQTIEKLANEAGLEYVSLGPVAVEAEHAGQIAKVPELIAATRAIFASVEINTSTLRPTAEAIKKIGALTENGFGNLRFAALACCQAGIPFFPAAYAAAGDFSCALASEGADLALNALAEKQLPADAMNELSRRIEYNAGLIEKALAGVQEETGARFDGCDWSLATHPDPKCSIGAAIEKMTGAPFGEWGTLSAIAALTSAVKRADVRHVGFSGVFLPMLEDVVLAKRTPQIRDLQQLLLYCSVCGSGLDTIPLAGDVSTDSIAALLGDVATLALVLQKPLTARLMPIPGLKEGESTRFDFPYLVNGQTMKLNGGGVKHWDDWYMGWILG